MRQRHVLFGVAIAAFVAAAAMAPAPASGQSTDEGAMPRTAWGHPDLQGYWTSSTYTPLERPESLGDQAFLSAEELDAANEILTAEGVDPLRARSFLAGATEEERLARTQQTQENIHYDNSIWLRENQPRRLTMQRTSLIVDPPNGRIPPLIPSAREREALRRAESRWLTTNISPQSFDSHETRTLQERCLVWRHEGPPMLPPSYNDLMQILQTEDYVVVMQEMRENDARIIPLDDRPHLPDSMREWSGDSRGRWEGDTLVVESINFNDKVHFNGSSTGLHVVERFTRIDDENIRYEFTVTDPTTWVRPWSVEYPLMKREGPLYEYACHEGNYDARHILEVARNLDRAAAAEASEGEASR